MVGAVHGLGPRIPGEPGVVYPLPSVGEAVSHHVSRGWALRCDVEAGQVPVVLEARVEHGRERPGLEAWDAERLEHR